MRGAKRNERRGRSQNAVPDAKRRPPVFLRRCLRPAAEFARLLRGSAAAVRQCRPVDATVVSRVSVCVPQSAGICAAGLAVAFFPRLSSKKTVRYGVLSTGLLRCRPPRNPDEASRLDLVKPMVLRAADGVSLGDIVVVAALFLQGPAGGGSAAMTNATRAAECAADQFSAFIKAKPPLNMQLAVRSHLKASGLGSCALEYCVVGRFTAGDAWRAGTAPQTATVHSRLFNALSGVSREASDAAGGSDGESSHIPAAAAQPRLSATSASPAGPSASVLLEHRSSFRDIFIPPCRVLSPLQSSIIRQLSAAVTEVAAASTALESVASPRAAVIARAAVGDPPVAGDKRPRESAAPAVGGAEDAHTELAAMATLIREAVGACMFPGGRPVVALALNRIMSRASPSAGGDSRLAAVAALVAEARGVLQMPPLTHSPCKRAGCVFFSAPLAAPATMAPAGRLSPHVSGSHQSKAASASAASCPCLSVRRRAWLTARRDISGRLACVPGAVRDPPDIQPWLDACQTVLRARQLLLGVLKAVAAATPAPGARVDRELERLVQFYALPPPPDPPPARQATLAAPVPLLVQGPVPPQRADPPRPGGSSLPPPLVRPASPALLTLFRPANSSRGAQQAQLSQLVARPVQSRSGGGIGSRGPYNKQVAAAPSLDGVRFVALPPPPEALRLSAPASPSAAPAAPAAAAASPPAPSPTSSLSPSGRRSAGPSTRASVSLAAAIQSSLANEGAALAEAFNAALRRGAAPASRRPNPLTGHGARAALPPAGRFIHSATGVPVSQAEDPVDSEDELAHAWLSDESAARLRALDDVSPEDKAVMLLWNSFAAERGRAVFSATALPQACVLFARAQRSTLRRLGLRAALLRLLVHLWDGAALDAESVAACLAALDEEGGE